MNNKMKQEIFTIKAYTNGKYITYDIIANKNLANLSVFDTVDLYYEMQYIQEIAENNGYKAVFITAGARVKKWLH